jgi:hypothetical protein
MANFDDPGGQASSSNCTYSLPQQESISQNHIAEIVERSRRKAQTMVVRSLYSGIE